ncbi:Lrp/AsnC family transcriptional regulator [Halocatena pleomorpha]|uniref:Lrp/AsnC family transcriptional regulator n=1 Tax=Halocatena pleomorpha TaxID=1785090 RepID=A0A3P3RLE9_9EURY|nr:Lrp/AsnC family transcriptional regulator [Halocatena pleomorpha]RRJ33690.1 Lrp/AsnC family transcriptional regulator [Halocatena pleomorpha]
MTDSDDAPNWDFKERDVYILRELSEDPQLSSRELADILEQKYGIDISHVTVSESIRGMREEGVFREAIIPNGAYFLFGMFEFKLNPEHFEETWREALEAIRGSPNTLFMFLSDGEYQWKSIMMFPNRRAESKWIHDFYKEYGDSVQNIRNSVVHNVLKFRTDAEILEILYDQ